MDFTENHNDTYLNLYVKFGCDRCIEDCADEQANYQLAFSCHGTESHSTQAEDQPKFIGKLSTYEKQASKEWVSK